MSTRYLLPESFTAGDVIVMCKAHQSRHMSLVDIEATKEFCTPVSDEPSKAIIEAMVEAFSEHQGSLNPSMVEAYKAAHLFMPTAKHAAAAKQLESIGYTHDGTNWTPPAAAPTVTPSNLSDAQIETMAEAHYDSMPGQRWKEIASRDRPKWLAHMRAAVDAFGLQLPAKTPATLTDADIERMTAAYALNRGFSADATMSKGIRAAVDAVGLNAPKLLALEWHIESNGDCFGLKGSQYNDDMRERAINAAAQHGRSKLIAVVARFERRSEVVEVVA